MGKNKDLGCSNTAHMTKRVGRKRRGVSSKDRSEKKVRERTSSH